MKNLLFLFSLICFAASANAQNATDTIYKRNGEVLLVKITEIGLDEVKYKPLYNPNDLVFVIEKSEIKRIVFANGVSQVFADPLKDKSVYRENHKNSIKFNFLSPIGDRAHFNWEHSIQPGVSIESGINFIGLGKRFGRYTPVGAVLNAGIRLYRLPDMKSRSDRYSHIMNGAYFQPTIAFGMTRHDYRSYTYSNIYPYSSTYEIKKAQTGYFMFFLNFGRQFVFANRISFDFSAGLGYGTYSNQYSNYGRYTYENGRDYYTNDDYSRYGFMIFPRELPLAVNAQFKLGYLFK